MTQPELPPDHESVALEDYRLKLARVALFDELIDMCHDGLCSFDEAITQYLHDASILESDSLGEAAA